jgi:D,D-heptose 1,7-bisphosphate phosphatase
MARLEERVRALLLAGSLDTRLRPRTDTSPQCLVPIFGRPLLDFWVNTLIEAGIPEARINTHAHAEQVREFVGSVNAGGRLRLSESSEGEPLGSAGTVAAHADLADDVEDVVIISSDNLSDVDLRPLLAYHRRHGDPMTMMLSRAPDSRSRGVAELDARGRVAAFVEGPERPAGELTDSGVYVATAAAYREIAAMQALEAGSDVLRRFLGRVQGWIWGGYHRDLGAPGAVEAARREAPTIFPDRPASGRDGTRPAVFLDRDGTLIEHVHYLSDPARVRLLPGAAEALRRLRRAGFARVLVTNQSAIGRGMLTVGRLAEIHAELESQLAAAGATLDAIYYCPAAPAGDDRTVVECPDRKPGPGMLLGAAAEMGLDLGASWMIGDLISDVLAGINAGCRSILVQSGRATPADLAAATDARSPIAADLATAVDLILSRQ